jgi:hypothetical protein
MERHSRLSISITTPMEAERSREAPFAVDVPDVFTQAFVREKDSRRFPQSGGWG